MVDEFKLIGRFFAPLERDDPALVVGNGDDGAVFTPRPGTHCVAVMDTLVSGRHFPTGLAADSVGYRAMAVNLSDLAAMGAVPRFATLALTLPSADEGWLEAFARGMREAMATESLSLIGGDTTQGPLSITVHLIGEISGDPLTRGGALPGHVVAVTGTLGDAAGGLALMLADGSATDEAMVGAKLSAETDAAERLRRRFVRPASRVELGAKLRGIASAAIDISDGLVADAGHLAAASQCAIEIDANRVPLSQDLLALHEVSSARNLALSGGDDYELLLALPRDRIDQATRLAAQCECSLSVIGEVISGSASRSS